jgi:hypothetical protein
MNNQELVTALLNLNFTCVDFDAEEAKIFEKKEEVLDALSWGFSNANERPFLSLRLKELYEITLKEPTYENLHLFAHYSVNDKMVIALSGLELKYPIDEDCLENYRCGNCPEISEELEKRYGTKKVA